jgi:hypothetical protein
MDVFRQASALNLLLRMAPVMRGETEFRVLVIGDGFGVLAALIKAIRPQARLTLVDIGKTLAIQSFFLGKTYPEVRHSLLESGSTPDNVDFLYVPAEQAQCLAGFRYEMAINIGSMQEMTPAVVSDYFNLFRECLVKDNRFYCCNRERKVLPGGEVLAIREYPWRPEDEILLDESSPWDRYFLGWTPTQRGPTIGEWRIPLVNSPDGEVIHRLAIMKTKEAA